MLKDTGRYRELASWCRGFKKQWRKLEKTPIEYITDAYRPNVRTCVCTCPAFSVNRFLLCKHLVQKVATTFGQNRARKNIFLMVEVGITLSCRLNAMPRTSSLKE